MHRLKWEAEAAASVVRQRFFCQRNGLTSNRSYNSNKKTCKESLRFIAAADHFSWWRFDVI